MHHPMLKGINKMFTITLCQVTHKYSQRPISSRDYAFEFSPRTQRPEPATQMLCEGRRHREGQIPTTSPHATRLPLGRGVSRRCRRSTTGSIRVKVSIISVGKGGLDMDCCHTLLHFMGK